MKTLAAVALVTASAALLAWAQTRPSAPKLTPLLTKVSSLMEAERMKPAPITDARLGTVVRAAITVDGQPLELRASSASGDRIAMFALQLKPLRAPERIDKNTMWRMFIETREYGAAHFAYNLEAKRFELRLPVFGSDLSAATLRETTARLKNMAQVTRNLWDDTRWK